MDRNHIVRVIPRDTHDILGEGPLWSPIHHTLLWVDIFAPAIRRLDLASGAVQSWEAPERIGWVVEREARDDLLVGLKSGFASLRLEPFGFERIGDPEPPAIFSGSATTHTPVTGTSPSARRFSRPATLFAAARRCTSNAVDGP